jgi:hypothetical protein
MFGLRAVEQSSQSSHLEHSCAGNPAPRWSDYDAVAANDSDAVFETWWAELVAVIRTV